MWHLKTLELLDYFKIRNEISTYCLSQEGKNKTEKLLPLTDSNRIKELKDLSKEWEQIILSNKKVPFSSWEEIQGFFKLLKVSGAVLEQKNFYALLQFTLSALELIHGIEAFSPHLCVKSLQKLTNSLPEKELELCRIEISKIIDKNGNLKDLPVLRELKSSISSLKSEIEKCFGKYTKDSNLNSVLASNVPVFRTDRQLLAVKANQRSRIPGIIHEVSNSGSTLFIEPEEIVRKNNSLIQLEFQLEAEKRKIFANLTETISVYADIFPQALEIMTEIDRTYAAARWGIEHQCIYAREYNKNDRNDFPKLVSARHPVLGQKAVPIDMSIPAGKTTVIITGPNTGGKTVSIKTFALLSLLNQTAFPVPAKEGTCLPVFSSLYADIGDEQSIEESLSTFSAHMKNIALAVKYADENSLVLLDELGSGTDPQEGGAVGMAVLDRLIEKKAFVLATTHHGILKNYGYTNSSCINASVDFDKDTLSPTYRLISGVPGESHALDIAIKSGLPLSTVEKAKSYITNNQTDVSTLIKGLTEKYNEISEIEKQTKARLSHLEEQELKLSRKLISLREQQLELDERERQSEGIFLQETRKNLENLVRKLREGEITREKTLQVKQFIAELTEKIEDRESALEEAKQLLEADKNELEEKLRKNSIIAENGMTITNNVSRHSSNKHTKKRMKNRDALEKTQEPVFTKNMALKTIKKTEPKHKEFKPGDWVILTRTKTKGILISEEKNNLWNVQIGAIRMKIKKDEMIFDSKENNAPSVTIEISSEETKETPVFELKLLGMRQEEAIKALERQLDLCQRHNFRNFSIIHGKGNGILQNAVHAYLAQYPAVKEFGFASAEDGGFGKTYVELK